MTHEPAVHQTNKTALQAAFAELAKGNTRPFGELMDNDFVWHMIGTTPWSGSYRGRQKVRDTLFGPLFAQFADQYTNTAQRFIAEGEYVVIECRGRVTTKSGKPYNNTYCYVCRFKNGKMKKLTEYMDTQLVVETLEAPPHAAATA